MPLMVSMRARAAALIARDHGVRVALRGKVPWNGDNNLLWR